MNRWPGSKDDSDRQAGERNQRAARRFLSNAVIDISLDDSELEFLECETSITNVDGADDLSSEEADDNMNAAQAEICYKM